jgi:small nuclear ribonucleoprotein (snRNP)-like protein
MTLEGRIIGFDEYMNIVLDESKEWYLYLYFYINHMIFIYIKYSY